MEMTIDMAITVLGMVEAHGVCIEAKYIAVETMRKYEKILDIIHCYNRYTDDAAECIENLRKVIEDGNDTTNTGSN